ncbi:Response regulator receiver protein [uncultured Desulfobacterium sp.]|uniref:Response regulator receiver protein n=1 Tax=uncultured Desulfobacterium sp. TaxID=201089 RepID=A0A445MVE3_9BACT|nr:Response regulator receiver protein [uncultured Desulfobacterium sp.]
MDLFVQLRKMRILLIDDDEWIRDSLMLFFESEQCKLTALETAEEGLDALREQKFDIIITDYWLPGMNGLDFFRRIKMSYKDAIKILITAYGSAGVFEEARKAGVHSLIAKPFTSDTVEAVLARLIINRTGQNCNTPQEPE